MSAEETERYSGEDGEGNDDEMDEDQETSSEVITDEDEDDDEEEEDAIYDPSEMMDLSKIDPEYFEYECLNVEKVEWLLNVSIETVTNSLAIKPALAKLLLHTHQWNATYIINEFKKDPNQLLILSRVKSQNPKDPVMTELPETGLKFCSVCYVGTLPEKFNRLNCGHGFCKDCWSSHFEIKITQGVSTGIACMALDCKVFATEDFVLNVLTKPHIRERYQGLAFQDYVGSHPELRFCPGLNCQVILRSKEPKAKRTECVQCKTVFCFKCGQEYHAPMDCSTMNKWRTKCADDSETANYLTANTKDCPKCLTCFEKNGGCNHMSCRLCSYEFCWICLEDWKRHSSNYECSKYKANPDTSSDENAQTRAREALKKYLHYYERWDNHCKSLKLEEHTLRRIKIHIDENVTQGHGTWIDWEYLIQAAALLAKCRYTLQYTYPYAFYLEPGSRKELFEYQQANLEAEIEDLSWKIERAEQTDRANLENQMDIAEKRRIVLLKDFLEP